MDKVWKFGNVAISPMINSCCSLGAAAKFLSCKKCIVHILQTQTTHLHPIFIPVVYIWFMPYNQLRPLSEGFTVQHRN